MRRLLCAGILALLPLGVNPAQAAPGFGTGTEIGAGWSQDRVRQVSRDEPMRPVGVTRTPQKAVAYLLELAENRAGGYYDQCLRLADDAYMPNGPRVATAFEQWRRAKRAGVAHPDDREPPLGAQMFWDPGHDAGHVATYVGDDRAVTNMPDGTVKRIKWAQMNDWGPYLGWALPYYK